MEKIVPEKDESDSLEVTGARTWSGGFHYGHPQRVGPHMGGDYA